MMACFKLHLFSHVTLKIICAVFEFPAAQYDILYNTLNPCSFTITFLYMNSIASYFYIHQHKPAFFFFHYLKLNQQLEGPVKKKIQASFRLTLVLNLWSKNLDVGHQKTQILIFQMTTDGHVMPIKPLWVQPQHSILHYHKLTVSFFYMHSRSKHKIPGSLSS